MRGTRVTEPLRDGGVLGFVVFASADRNPWGGVPAKTLVERGDEQVAVREAIMEGMAAYRNEDGSHTAPAVCIGALTR